MHLHRLCVGGFAPAPEDYRCPCPRIRSSPHLLPEPVSRQLLRKLPKVCTDSPSASGAPENCRIRLAFSLLAVLSITVAHFPGGSAAEDLDGPLVLLGGDLASGEALPEDLLRRVPGCLRSLVPANLGKDAHHQPRYDGHEPAQKQDE